MSPSDNVLLRVPAVTEESTRTIRSLSLPSCVSHWLTSVIGIFCIGLVSGFGGGCLLGKTAVVSLKSLEILADDELLMDNLTFYTEEPNEEIKLISQRTIDEQVTYFVMSALIEMLGVCSSIWSLGLGVFIGLSTYDFMIRKYGETAKEKALFLAGPVCLMGVTATGYLLGLGLESYLYSPLKFIIPFIFSVVGAFIYNIMHHTREFPEVTLKIIFLPLISSGYGMLIIWMSFTLLKTKLTLIVLLLPANWILSDLNCDFHDTVWSLPLMLIMTDVFNIVKQPIITFDSPKMAHVAVLEGLFVGVLTYQCFVMVVGMSLFESWRTGGAAKICFSAAALGGAVITVVESVLHVLGPGPTIGALTGIAGTAGVSLAAGMAMTDHGSFLGRLGVAVGAAVGAFLSSCSHSGLSGLFMSLWAAMIAAGLCLQMLLLFLSEHDTWWSFFLSVFMIVVTITCFSVWFYFTCTIVATGLVYIFVPVLFLSLPICLFYLFVIRKTPK